MKPAQFLPAPVAQLPWRMLFLVMAIAGFGLVVLYSAAGGSVTPWALNQGVRFGFFFAVAVALSRVPERWFRDAAFPAYALFLLLLFVVEAVGFVGKGAQRWIDLGFIRLQPSEFMKIGVVLAVARFYDLLPAGEIRRWTAIWPAGLLISVPVVLVMLQPDLGTSLMIMGGGVIVMFLAGLPLRLFVGSALAGAAAIPFAYFFLLHEYQRKRVTIFLEPEADPLGAGYHITQSKIAIGSGGVFGKGFLQGTQSHLDYLPEGHTDFVFATMAEEWGLLGGLPLILGFVLLLRWGMGVAMRAETRFGRLTAAGLTNTIFLYFSINLLMVMGLAPVVGIPLPLFSFGGSAMMTVMFCLGILMSIDRASSLSLRW